MKIGTENKKQVRFMIALLAIALLVGIYNFANFGAGPAAPATTATGQQTRTSGPDAGTSNLDPRLHLDSLAASQSKKYEAGGRNIFRMEEARIEPAKFNVRPAEVAFIGPPTPTPTPPPPPITLKFYGFASKSNEPKRVFLANEGGAVFIAKQGDIVERKYKVIQINNTNVMIEDVLYNNRQPIPLTAK